MRTKARNVPLFTYGPEVSLPELPATNPHRMLETYLEVDASAVDFRELMASERVLAYLTLPPVTLATADIAIVGLEIHQLREQMERELYPAKMKLLEYKHLPRIFDLINRHSLPGWDSPLIERSMGRNKGRNIFAFAEQALELIPAEESASERKWELQPPQPWKNCALKKSDRVFLIKELYIAP